MADVHMNICTSPCATSYAKLPHAQASDYITKPYNTGEVLARIDTQLRLYIGEMQEMQARTNGSSYCISDMSIV